MTFRSRIGGLLPFGKALRDAAPDWLRSRRLRKRRDELLEANRDCRDAADIARFAEATFGTGQVHDEILAFIELAAARSPRAVCEIGIADGGTTFLLGRSLPDCRLLIGVDLYVKNRSLLRLLKPEGQRFVPISGSSRSPRTRRRVERALGGDELDLLFIDGDHSYEGVKRDFLDYRGLVRSGGMIAFHDICAGTSDHPATGNVWVGGVPRFWEEVKATYEHRELVHDRESPGFGIGVLRYEPER